MLGKSQVKYIQSLGQKKHRDQDGVFIAEGPKILREWIDSKELEIVQLFAMDEWLNANTDTGIEVTPVSAIELAKISQLQTPNQVLAIVRKPQEQQLLQSKGRFSLALDTIQDPGNMGTIVRIADWFGVSQLICSADCADLYNPKVVQSAMGSIARVNSFYTDLPAWLAGQQDTMIYAAALEGEPANAIKKSDEGILVIGNESKGISSEVFNQVKLKITIPRIGKAESLNAAVATGILLSYLRLGR